MTNDYHLLMTWIRVVTIVAAVCATAFPMLYSFSPWYSTVLGRVLMAHGVVLALALDVSAIFMYWKPKSVLVPFWIDVFIFTFIAGTNVALCIVLIHLNYQRRLDKFRLIVKETIR